MTLSLINCSITLKDSVYCNLISQIMRLHTLWKRGKRPQPRITVSLSLPSINITYSSHGLHRLIAIVVVVALELH